MQILIIQGHSARDGMPSIAKHNVITTTSTKQLMDGQMEMASIKVLGQTKKQKSYIFRHG